MPRKENRTIELVYEPLPTAIRILLAEKNFSIKYLAENLKVTKQAVSLYCLGYSSPDFKTLCKIADFFNVTTDYLLGRSKCKTTNIENEVSDVLSPVFAAVDSIVNCLAGFKPKEKK